MSYYWDKGQKVYGVPYSYQGEASDWTVQKALDTFEYVCCPDDVASFADITEHAIFADIAEEKENGVALQTYQRYGYMKNKVQRELSDESFKANYRPCSEVKEQIRQAEKHRSEAERG